MDTTRLNFPIKEFETLIDSCKVLCQEVISDETSTAEFPKKMFLTNNEKNVVNSLDSLYYEKLLTIIGSSKQVLVMFNDKRVLEHIRPAALAFMITLEKQLNSELFSQQNFQPEKHFTTFARGRSYKLEQLETAQDQHTWVLMLNSPFEETVEKLKKSIDDYSKEPTDGFLNYQKQNLKILDDEEFSDSIMVLRNQNMANSIEKLLTENKSVFVMIGAAHLLYETRVLNLLSQKGFLIKPYIVNLNKE